MSKPLVSIIMPVYNAEAYLLETIKSILSQSLTDFEFIIINDSSTDCSKDIILSFPDNRIKYIENKKNMGYIFSLNNSLTLAKGHFLARMDADDISLPNRLMNQYDFLIKEKSIDLVGSSVKVLREDHKKKPELWDYPLTPGGVKARLLFNTAHAHPVVFFRRTLVDRKLYYYDENFYPAEDYHLWVRLNRHVNTANLQEPQLIYRIREGQTSAIAFEKQIHCSSVIRSDYFISFIAANFLKKETLYDFWKHGFKIDQKKAMLIFEGYLKIYNNATDLDFKEEIINQVNQLVNRAYQRQPQFINAYRKSEFNIEKPFSFIEKNKFSIYQAMKVLGLKK